MKPSYFILALLCAFSMAFVSCENNDPDTKKGGDNTTSQHQPANPATWSPVGHKYVSIDNDTLNGRYKGWTVEFLSRDSVLRVESGYPFRSTYRLQYPNVYLGTSETPWYKFIDTLTITRYFDSSDCPTYKMEY